jgi:glyoxylase-like metal-dependent hydrolase (beta-lactamase superfamily II)
VSLPGATREWLEEEMEQIRTIELPLPLGLGTVNCYLVQAASGFVLIDTGAAKGRARLEAALASAGCSPGDLRLIVLTHGDFDHTGNAAYLRDRFGAPIAMHSDDAGMAQGDMFSNRTSGNALMRLIAPLLFRFSRSSRFEPDIYVEEGDDFSEYGIDARVLSIPGHSQGSIGVLTAGGDLFCGDLLENAGEPSTNSIMDDEVTCDASIEKLDGFEIDTVYPGHGDPFPMSAFMASCEANDRAG